MRQNIPSKDLFINQKIPGRDDEVITELIGTGNNGHVFKSYSKALQRTFACKIIPKLNLTTTNSASSNWKSEIEKPNSLRNNIVVKFIYAGEWVDTEHDIDCVVLVSDYVDGVNLKKFIDKNRNEVTISLILTFLKTILRLLHEMNSRGIEHGDLHAGNIIVEDQSSYMLDEESYAFRVTDFGVVHLSDETQFKDDYIQLASVLKQMLECISYQNCSPKEKFIFNTLNNKFLARHLVEEDPTIDPIAKNSAHLFNSLKRIDEEYEKSKDSEDVKLTSPFDYLSCEQIGDAPNLLKALYSELFLGLHEIESRNNIIVTGPRGCGKSTVFKNLSLKHKFRINESAEINYIGVYYRCDDLYFSFPRYKVPDRAEALDIPVHFITSTLLSNLLEITECWAKTYHPEQFKDQEQIIAQEIWNILETPPPKKPGANSLKSIIDELHHQRIRVIDKYRFSHDLKRPIGKLYGVDTLFKACGALTGSFTFLKKLPIYFFIDDYSMPKVTRDLQENLNRVFMQRNSTCFFKISTESPISFSKSDIDGKTYVENREYTLHNLGLIYLHADVKKKMEFIDDVFNRRLTASVNQFPVQALNQLLGSNEGVSFNEEARLLKNNKKTELWGKEILCRLCSGDIHYLISLVGQMVTNAGGPDQIKNVIESPRVSSSQQNKAIREGAGNFLNSLLSVPKHGQRLVDVVTSFGNVSHSYLKYKTSKNEKGNPPHQASRIEPFEAFELSADAQAVYNELLRYSVFIEDMRGKSRRGKVVPRLFLRRLLIPQFNLTFSNRDSIEISPDVFQNFLLNPNEFEKAKRLKSESPLDLEDDLFNESNNHE